MRLDSTLNLPHLPSSGPQKTRTLMPGIQLYANARQQPELSVNISVEGKLLSGSASLYGAFFPTRLGFNADALALNTAMPQATSSSTGLEMPEVAEKARHEMNAMYKAMFDSGAEFSFNSNEGQDENTLFGSFDRRSLLAVAENQSGLFSDDEQRSARRIMDQQRSLASGEYSGPTRLKHSFESAKNILDVHSLAANFLDNVSAEEKATSAWSHNRVTFGSLALERADDNSMTSVSKLLTLLSGRQSQI